jgi:hypothetical protein
VPDRAICLGIETSLEEQVELLAFLDKNNDIFTGSPLLVGECRDIIKHILRENLNANPRKQKLHKMSEEKVEAAKVEV